MFTIKVCTEKNVKISHFLLCESWKDDQKTIYIIWQGNWKFEPFDILYVLTRLSSSKLKQHFSFMLLKPLNICHYVVDKLF